MEAMVERLCQRLDQLDEPVVLVGHSMGGAIISNLAELRPQKVAQLVYVTALLLASGERTATALSASASSPHVRLSANGTWIEVDPVGARDLFYGHCSDDDVALARCLLVPEKAAVSATPVIVSMSAGDEFHATMPSARATPPSRSRCNAACKRPCPASPPIRSKRTTPHFFRSPIASWRFSRRLP
jgi:pimeloyl-ACP methyl ester carboxylesterase